MRLEKISQNDRFVVSRIACRIKQSYTAVFQKLIDLVNGITIGGEFGAVTLRELMETLRLVAKPFAKLGARRDLLQPHSQFRSFLADTTWPQPIDQDARTIVLAWGIVYPLQVNIGDSSGHFTPHTGLSFPAPGSAGQSGSAIALRIPI